MLDYLNAQATTILERLPSTEFHPMKRKSSPSTSPFDFRNSSHNVSLLSPNAHSNFMYANWIGLHAKAPEQTGYLFNIPGKILRILNCIYVQYGAHSGSFKLRQNADIEVRANNATKNHVKRNRQPVNRLVS